MKILVLSDTQIAAGLSLAVDRLADQERMLAQIADIADEHDVDAVVHCGDVFEHRHPSEEARLVFKRWAQRIANRRALIVLSGNHDLSNTGSPSSLELYDDCVFVREPRVIDLGGCSLACLPWAPVSGLVARVGGGDRDEVNALAAECLVGIARDLYTESVVRNPAAFYAHPTILATHFWIEGATSATGAGEGVIHEPVLPINSLEAIGFDAIYGGHVHKAQGLGWRTHVVGSPWVCSWGEVGQEHRVLIVDTDRPAQPEAVAIADRSFVTVSLDLTDQDSPDGRAVSDPVSDAGRGSGAQEPGMGARTPAPNYLNETDLVVAALAEHLPLADAVIRVSYRATEKQHRRVDHAALAGFLADARVHRVYGGIKWIPVKAERARAEGIDETLDPLAAVELWASVHDVGEERTRGLLDLTAEALGAVGA